MSCERQTFSFTVLHSPAQNSSIAGMKPTWIGLFACSTLDHHWVGTQVREKKGKDRNSDS